MIYVLLEEAWYGRPPTSEFFLTDCADGVYHYPRRRRGSLAQGSMSSDEKAALAQLNKLRRLPANKKSASCNTECVSPTGFPNVCEKYKTFVCSMCKSSHQSFSHRVKHASMSTWTVDEVAALEYGRGGGNEYARETYFANLDEHSGEWPSKGDKLEVFKQFIDKAYNKLYWNDGAVSKSKKSKHKKRKEKKKKKHAKAPTDQWDFTGELGVQEDFDLFGPVTTGPETNKRAVSEKPFENNTLQAASSNTAEFDFFEDEDPFQASNPNFDVSIPTALSGDDEPSDQFGEFTSFTSNNNDVSKKDNSFDVFAPRENTSTHNSAEDIFASFGELSVSSGPEEELSHKKKKSKKKKKKSRESSIEKTRDDDLLSFGGMEEPAASSDFMASITNQSSTASFSTTNRGAPSTQSTPDAFDPFCMLSGSLASSQAAPPMNINTRQSQSNPSHPPSFNDGMGATSMQSSVTGLGGFGQTPFMTGAPYGEFLGGRSINPVAPSTGNCVPVGHMPSLQKKQAPSSHHDDPFAGLVNF